MLHKLSGSYSQIAKHFPELKGLISSSAHKKQQLLEMARRGEPRPSGTKSDQSLVSYLNLVSYTNQKSSCYDPIFTKNIKKLAPQWFVTKYDIANEKKRQLIEMAKKGDPKPYYKTTKLGSALLFYTRKTSPSYDHIFTKNIKKLAPQWFVTKHDIANEKKRQLLRMAMNKLPLPMTKTKLGGALRSYTRTTSKSYDPIFDSKIRKAAPSWFVPQSEIADEKKRKLLDLARQGKPRPNQKNPLGRVLCNYTCRKCGSFDPNFTSKIKEAAPKWFVPTRDVAKKNKRMLLALAKKGKPRPSQKTSIGSSLSRYTTKKGSSYDLSFDERIRKIAPLWFANPADQKKKNLLEIARNGKCKPDRKNPLGKALQHYTYKQSPCYDPVFASKIRKLAPHWFKRKCSTR